MLEKQKEWCQNKVDVFKVIDLSRNLNKKDQKKIK